MANINVRRFKMTKMFISGKLTAAAAAAAVCIQNRSLVERVISIKVKGYL